MYSIMSETIIVHILLCMTEYAWKIVKIPLQLEGFRQAAEDRHTHLYQTPYYPPPEDTQATGHRKDQPAIPETGKREIYTLYHFIRSNQEYYMYMCRY